MATTLILVQIPNITGQLVQKSDTIASAESGEPEGLMLVRFGIDRVKVLMGFVRHPVSDLWFTASPTILTSELP